MVEMTGTTTNNEMNIIDMDVDGEGDSSSFDSAMRDQKNVFMHTFKVFVQILEEKIQSEGDAEKVVHGAWWKWTTGCMIELGRLVC